MTPWTLDGVTATTPQGLVAAELDARVSAVAHRRAAVESKRTADYREASLAGEATGANAEARKASLTLLCGDDDEYQLAVEDVAMSEFAARCTDATADAWHAAQAFARIELEAAERPRFGWRVGL